MTPELADHMRAMRDVVQQMKDEIRPEYQAAAMHGSEQEWARMVEVADRLGIEMSSPFFWGMIVSGFSTIMMLRELGTDLPAHLDEVIPRIVGVALAMEHSLNRLEHDYDLG